MIYLLLLEGTCPFRSLLSLDKCEARVLDMLYGSLKVASGRGEEAEEHSHRNTLPQV